MSRLPPSPATWTYEDYASLPDDGNRYEVLDGEVLVTPAPGTLHQHVLGKLMIVLWQYVEKHGLGHIFPGVDLLFVSGQYLCPDILFVPAEVRDGITPRGVERTPGLVVEILSQGSRSVDRVKKPRRYGEFGVPEYWVVDADDRVIWRWRFARSSEPERVADQLLWQPDAATEPLLVDVGLITAPF